MNLQSVVIFDGECVVCNRAVDFIIARDPGERFVFATSQCEPARALMARHGVDGLAADTLILVEEDQVTLRSEAVLGDCGRAHLALALVRCAARGAPALAGCVL